MPLFGWLLQNLSTIIIAVILFVAICTIFVKLIKDRKNGKSSCGCGCSSCPMSETCHKK